MTESTPTQFLIFGEIPKLPESWWTTPPTDNPTIVWTVWQENTWYLWGANAGNYINGPIGTIIGGDGMAGTKGPTRGRYHPHYVGVITMDATTMPKNDAVFAAMQSKIAAGDNVLIPIFKDDAISESGYKLSLGTGIGSSQPNWGAIQKYILSQMVTLAKKAQGLQFDQEVYWPDLRQNPVKTYPVKSVQDLENIVNNVL